jgi:hypothetical protein
MCARQTGELGQSRLLLFMCTPAKRAVAARRPAVMTIHSSRLEFRAMMSLTSQDMWETEELEKDVSEERSGIPLSLLARLHAQDAAVLVEERRQAEARNHVRNAAESVNVLAVRAEGAEESWVNQ